MTRRVHKSLVMGVCCLVIFELTTSHDRVLWMRGCADTTWCLYIYVCDFFLASQQHGAHGARSQWRMESSARNGGRAPHAGGAPANVLTERCKERYTEPAVQGASGAWS